MLNSSYELASNRSPFHTGWKISLVISPFKALDTFRIGAIGDRVDFRTAKQLAESRIRAQNSGHPVICAGHSDWAATVTERPSTRKSFASVKSLTFEGTQLPPPELL